jgi:hypothetical protein
MLLLANVPEKLKKLIKAYDKAMLLSAKERKKLSKEQKGIAPLKIPSPSKKTNILTIHQNP